MAKLRRKLKMALTKKAPKSYHSRAGLKHLQRKKKKKTTYSSLRTQGIERKLRAAGLSESDIKKLRGSKDE